MSNSGCFSPAIAKEKGLVPIVGFVFPTGAMEAGALVKPLVQSF